MKVVITSATDKEIILIKQELDLVWKHEIAGLAVLFHKSGVGMLSSCFSIAKLIFAEKPDLIIQAGIAGSFNNNDVLGKVVTVKDEIPGDMGVEENGTFKDLVDLDLQQENLFPFVGGKLPNPFLTKLNYLNLDEVTSITINEITTRRARIETLKSKYQPAIESMEGAALHYCCLQTSTPFIQIRSISNYIGERDKSKWNFKVALENLAASILNYIEHLNKVNDTDITSVKERNNEIYNRL